MTTANNRLSRALKRVMSAPARRMRSRGFGVHSPFAFSFITSTLKRRYSYYAYDQLKQIAKANGIPRKQLQILFRIAVRFDVRTAACFGPGSTAYKQTLRLVRKDITFNADEAQLIVANGTDSSAHLLAAIRRTIKSGGIIIVDHRKLQGMWQEALSMLDDKGMSFATSSIGIIIARTHLPRQHFEISL